MTTEPRTPAARTRRRRVDTPVADEPVVNNSGGGKPRVDKPRVDKPRVDRRRAIVDAAIELAGERPFDEVNVADIADRAGVSHGLLFYYFSDKWAVTTEALRLMLDELRDFQWPRLTETTPRGRMTGFARRHIEFALQRRDAYLALMRGGPMSRSEVRTMVEEARRDGVAVVADIVGLPAPRSPTVDLALLSWVAGLDVCTEQVLTRDDLDLDEVVAWLVDRLFRDVEAVAGQSVDDPPA